MAENEKVPAKIKQTDQKLIDHPELIQQLFGQGKAVLMGGTTAVKGRTVYVIHISKDIIGENKQVEVTQAWYFYKGRPGFFGLFAHNGLHYIDSREEPVSEYKLVRMDVVCIVTEVDASLAEEEIDRRELQEVIDWALARIDVLIKR